MTPDQLADAASRKAAAAPRGEKRRRERVAAGARCLALALGVREMRICMRKAVQRTRASTGDGGQGVR